jgi:hypothetical protein
MPALQPYGKLRPLAPQVSSQLISQLAPEYPAVHEQVVSNSLIAMQLPWLPQSTAAQGLASQVMPV